MPTFWPHHPDIPVRYGDDAAGPDPRQVPPVGPSTHPAGPFETHEVPAVATSGRGVVLGVDVTGTAGVPPGPAT